MVDGRTRGARAWTTGAATALSLILGGFGLSGIVAGPARAESVEGAFLKAHYAALNNRAADAALFYRTALIFDSEAPLLLRNAFRYSLLVGETEEASRLAPRLALAEPTDRLARLVMVADALKDARPEEAEALLASPIAEQTMLPMTRRALRAWAAFGRGDKKAAEAILLAAPPTLPKPQPPEDAAAWADEPGMRAEADSRHAARVEAVDTAYRLFGNTHLGLMAAADGRDADAADAFFAAKEAAGGWTIQLGVETAGALRRLGRDDEAAAVYDALLGPDGRNASARAAKASFERGERPSPVVETVAEGAAAVLYGVGVSIGREREDAALAIHYLQLARHLAPDFHDARFAAASALSDLDQLELAAEAYAGVPPQSPLGELARIGRAESLARAGDHEGSLTVLNRLASEGSDHPSVYLTIGAVENAEGRFTACAAAYEKALTLMSNPTWRVLLRLGVCREQEGDWPSAEAAFVEALALEPKQPDVLNHFGYGLVIQGRRLDEARRMLEIAVDEQPDSGYIVDSLGWALYQLGDYETAVQHLENAVALTPTESVIHDHYGDALWKVGRRMEARFQWRRALSYDPEENERPLIERKLEIGLDRALAEVEGSPAVDGPDAAGGPKKVEVQAPETQSEDRPHDG